MSLVKPRRRAGAGLPAQNAGAQLNIAEAANTVPAFGVVGVMGEQDAFVLGTPSAQILGPSTEAAFHRGVGRFGVPTSLPSAP